MFLKRLIIFNNKSCKKIILEPARSEPEVLIGINDCGKSTILKSLEVVFDEKKSCEFLREDKQKSDLSNSPLTLDEINSILIANGYPKIENCLGEMIAFICDFDLEELDINDESFQENSKNLHLKWAIGDSTKVTILRIFNNADDQNISGYYLLTNDYKKDGEFIEAWNKSKPELKKIRGNLGVKDEDVKNENNQGPFKNIEEIRAIYKKVETELQSRWSKYKDFSKDKVFFPNFKYLDWNFSLQDLEDMATEAMKEVTNPLLKEIKALASTKQKEAVEGINKKFTDLMGDLKNELPENISKISSSVFFDVDQRITDIKLTKENIDGEVHIDNQGEGVKRQIWFALLKWRSKLLGGKVNKNKYLWCFDEPETHLYPAAQRQLFDTFKEMCGSEFQILLSTHSTIFIDRTKIQDVNQITLDNGYSIINKSHTTEDVFDSLSLKNSDFLFYDKFLAVEGPTEYKLIPHLYQLRFNKKLSEDGIQLVNLGGKNQRSNYQRILSDVLRDFKKDGSEIYYLLNTDSGVSGQNIFTSGIYDLEDSISNKIWIGLVKGCCDIDLDDDILNTQIRDKLENEHDKKFLSLLSNYIAQNINTGNGNYLPGKGSDLGNLLAQYLTDVEEIPEQIIRLFESINPAP